MQDDFHQILKKYPLLASKNPQLDLLDDDEWSELEIRRSELHRNVWNMQKKKLARFSADSSIREYVEPANRFRDKTRSAAAETDPSVEWPEFDLPDSKKKVNENKSGIVSLPGMQTAEQDEALRMLFEKISQQLCLALSHPCPVFEDRYSVRVEFFDCIAWVALKIEQVIKMEIKDSEGDWQLSTFRFNVLKPMQTASWIDQVLLTSVGELVLSFGEYAARAFNWLKKELSKRFQNDAALLGIRHQVTHHMSVDSRVIPAILHIKRQAGMRQILMNTEMGEIWPRADFWAELYQKYPHLTLLCHLAMKGGNDSAMSNVSEVRSVCLRHGLSPGGWRYLLRKGESAYKAVITSGIGESRAFTMAIGLVEWQSRSGLSGTLPREMALAHVNFAALALLDSLTIADYVDPRIAKIAAEQHAQLEKKEDRARFVERDWLDILIWMRNSQPDIDKNQWRAGWSCIWKKYVEWLGERDTTTEWESRVRKISIFGMKVKALLSSAELCLEGMKMHHCISSYAKQCKKGSYRVFSIRDSTTGKRIATAGLKLIDDCWKLDHVKGKNNRKVSDKVESLSKSLAGYYQQSHLRYEAGIAVADQPTSITSPSRTAGFFHLKVSSENCLMKRSKEDTWKPAQYEEYPISAELKSEFEVNAGKRTSQESNIGSAELTLKLRLELPSEFTVYIWDSVKHQDRRLSVDC